MDYTEVGLMVGLEVHQQLLTRNKMFCRCPAGRYTRTHDGSVLRHMRPTLSELGEYDGTALMEFKTKKNIIYLLHEDNVCTYEMDDTPPFLVNKDAVDVAIEQCLMLGCDIVDEVHIARKPLAARGVEPDGLLPRLGALTLGVYAAHRLVALVLGKALEAVTLSPTTRELLLPAVVWGATMLAVALAARSARLRPVLA